MHACSAVQDKSKSHPFSPLRYLSILHSHITRIQRCHITRMRSWHITDMHHKYLSAVVFSIRSVCSCITYIHQSLQRLGDTPYFFLTSRGYRKSSAQGILNILVFVEVRILSQDRYVVVYVCQHMTVTCGLTCSKVQFKAKFVSFTYALAPLDAPNALSHMIHTSAARLPCTTALEERSWWLISSALWRSFRIHDTFISLSPVMQHLPLP